jgi:hypothetical protein
VLLVDVEVRVDGIAHLRRVIWEASAAAPASVGVLR